MCKIPARNYGTIKKYLFHIRYLFTLNVVMAFVGINFKLLIRLSNILINSKNTPISGNAVRVFDI